MRSLAVDPPFGGVVRSVGIGSRPPAACSPSPPRWWGRITPSSVVAATLPSWGGRDHGPSGPKRPSVSLGTPLLERGMCVKTRHLCARVLRTHPYRGGGIKDFGDESHEFVRAIEPRLGGASSDDLGGSRNRAGGRQGTPLKLNGLHLAGSATVV